MKKWCVKWIIAKNIIVGIAVLILLSGCKGKPVVDSRVKDVNCIVLSADRADEKWTRGIVKQVITFDDNSVLAVVNWSDRTEPVGRGKRVKVYRDWTFVSGYIFTYPMEEGK